jgi:hypothetical protein
MTSLALRVPCPTEVYYNVHVCIKQDLKELAPGGGTTRISLVISQWLVLTTFFIQKRPNLKPKIRSAAMLVQHGIDL